MAAPAPLLACERLRSAALSGAAAAQDPAYIAVLHGVTGSSGQLAPFTQRLIDAAATAAGRPIEAILLNQRGHGASRDLPFPPPHSVDACTDDAVALLRWALRGRDGAPPKGAKLGLWMSTNRMLSDVVQHAGLAGCGPPHIAYTPTCRRHELGTQAPLVILGHSLGGKVALSVLARLAAEGAQLPKQVRRPVPVASSPPP